MSRVRKADILEVEHTGFDEGDTLSNEVHLVDTVKELKERDRSLCDGEGGRAPSKGTLAQ